jgi:hypothetical protein
MSAASARVQMSASNISNIWGDPERKTAGSDPAAKPFGFRGIAMLCFALPCHFRIEARLSRWPLDTGPKPLVARLPVSS